MTQRDLDPYRLVADPGALAAAGLFIVEGRQAIARLLRTSHQVVSLLLTPAARMALAPVLGAEEERILEVTPAQMREITGFNFHRGALALARRPGLRGLDDLVDGIVGRGPALPGPDGSGSSRRDARPVLVVTEHLVDVDNVGSCFRNALAFGAAAVLVDDRSADPLHRKAIRTSMGAVLEVPWGRAPISGIVAALRARDVTILALAPDERSRDLHEVATTLARGTAVALLVGNEGHGLSGATLAASTHVARIPMAQGADSLNVATALAIALYQLSLSGLLVRRPDFA